MKRVTAAAGCLIAALSLGFAEDIRAVTKKGKQVVLHSDGTWEYAEIEAATRKKGRHRRSQNATENLASKKKFCEIWFDPEKWTASPAEAPPSEFTFVHSSGDAYAMLIVERLAMPLETLKSVALSNARSAAPDTEVLQEETRRVNGTELLFMKFAGTSSGIPFTYNGYYWTGDAGTLQFLAYTGSNLAGEFEKDMIELLDGLVLTKP